MGIMITYRGYDNPGIMYTEPWIHIIHGKIQYSQQANAKAVWGGYKRISQPSVSSAMERPIWLKDGETELSRKKPVCSNSWLSSYYRHIYS